MWSGNDATTALLRKDGMGSSGGIGATYLQRSVHSIFKDRMDGEM
jgi:hypothetical protein